ncbi:hypothetical protein FVE85_6630 [Porphyridium purpureum]|uniref:Uncharacterized protein n=1 Tax=Porphyridium purpureum TaxID=35688 RepID=A0A5J4Z6U5_PORPP|nr:hypothetical protein FVE85_6630 [Porphyridium purpureum]|eukprot:POR7431..scf295_1
MRSSRTYGFPWQRHGLHLYKRKKKKFSNLTCGDTRLLIVGGSSVAEESKYGLQELYPERLKRSHKNVKDASTFDLATLSYEQL